MTDLLVVGGGPGGVAAARTAGRLGARVTLIERSGLGGTCVHAGCIPSGALHRTVTALDGVAAASRTGVAVGPASVDWPRMLTWSGSVVQSAARLTRTTLEAAGIEVLAGSARFTGPSTVVGGDRTFEGVPVVLATGAISTLPPSERGSRRTMSNEDAMALDGAPGRLLVSGAGRFSIEWADFFHHLGTDVTVSATGARILPDEDADIAGLLQLLLEQRGIRFLLGPDAHAEDADVDALLMADARTPNLVGLDLEATGVATSAGAVRVDAQCRTSVPGIYAAGDVTGPPWLSNRARAQGIAAATNALGGSARLRPERIPRSVNTHPELAAVGLTEAQATARGGQVAIGISELAMSLRGMTLGEDQGALKLVVDSEFGEILGGHMLGAGATEVIAQVATAMELEADYRELGRVQHVHPSLAELVTEAIASI